MSSQFDWHGRRSRAVVVMAFLGLASLGACSDEMGEVGSETHWLCSFDEDCPAEEICEEARCVPASSALGRSDAGSSALTRSDAGGGGASPDGGAGVADAGGVDAANDGGEPTVPPACEQQWSCSAWRAHSTLTSPRRAASSLKLADGRILLVGGYHDLFDEDPLGMATTDLFDPTTGSWQSGPVLSFGRLQPELFELADGRVLVVGTRATGSSDTQTAALERATELLDLDAGTATRVGDTVSPRTMQSGAVLDDGRVLVAGGLGSYATWTGLTEAEIYDPTTQAWSATTPLPEPLAYPTIDVLPDGRALLVGQRETGHRDLICSDYVSAGYTFDPVAESWSPIDVGCVPELHQSVRTDDGRLAFVGGIECDWIPECASAYDPATDTWSELQPSMLANGDAVLLPDGRVMLVPDVRPRLGEDPEGLAVLDTDGVGIEMVPGQGGHQGGLLERGPGCEVLWIAPFENTASDQVWSCGGS